MSNQDTGLDNPENVSEGDASETIESLTAKLEAANNEAAKYRRQKNDIVKERDALKNSKVTEETKSWETLYKQSQEEKNALLDTTKKHSINAAIKESLLKQGVLPDALRDASKLVDSSIIQWNAEDGVDDFSVESAVKALRSSSKYLFESKINPSTNVANAKNGSTRNEKEMSRSQWNSIADPQVKAQAAINMKIVD